MKSAPKPILPPADNAPLRQVLFEHPQPASQHEIYVGVGVPSKTTPPCLEYEFASSLSTSVLSQPQTANSTQSCLAARLQNSARDLKAV